MNSAASGPTARELFWSVPQPDDAGAQTADRFDWQAAMATSDCLALYNAAMDDSGVLVSGDAYRIVCERHEDWAVVVEQDVELVSAKHRDRQYGAYTTVNQLAEDGGIAHLFGRWWNLSEMPTCRLVTTPALAGAAHELGATVEHLRNLRLGGAPLTIGEAQQKPIKELCKAIRRYTDTDDLPEAWRENTDPKEPTENEQAQIARFLSMLIIDHSRPLRDIIGHAAASMYVKPILERLGAQVTPEPFWQAVHDLVRSRMRAAGPLPSGKLPTVLAYKPGTPLPSTMDLERADISRIVTAGDIELVINLAISNPQGFASVRPVPRLSRVAIKMAAGDCGETSIERAEDLLREYREYWHDRISGDPGARVEQDKLRRLLHRLADEAEAEASTPTIHGRSMWKILQQRIDKLPPEVIPPGMDPALLLGGVCELVNDCKVWFSPRFDVDAEIARCKDPRGEAS